jgi:hypothetical protein
MTKYLGFYTSRPFFVGKEIDKPLDNTNWIEHNRLMGEKICQYQDTKYKLIFCRDGMILFHLVDFDQILRDKNIKETQFTEKWAIYLDYLNTLYLLLDCNISKSMYDNTLFSYLWITELTFRDVFPVEIEESNKEYFWILKGCRERYKFEYNQFDGISIPIKICDLINNDLGIIINNYRNIKILSNISKSLSEYKIANFSISLVLSWFIIEMFLKKYWDDFLNNKNETFPNEQKRINTDRKNYLEGRDYTISIISNTLELNDIISYELFKKIDRVRVIRNNIVHKNIDCSQKDSALALEIIEQFINKEMSINISFNTSLIEYGI